MCKYVYKPVYLQKHMCKYVYTTMCLQNHMRKYMYTTMCLQKHVCKYVYKTMYLPRSPMPRARSKSPKTCGMQMLVGLFRHVNGSHLKLTPT